MDRRELRNYVDMPHFHPEKNVINGVDVYKNGRFRQEIRHEMEHKTAPHIPPLRIRSFSTGSEGEPASPVVGSPAQTSGSPLPSAGGFLTRAFHMDQLHTTGDKHLKHELDFKWQ